MRKDGFLLNGDAVPRPTPEVGVESLQSPPFSLMRQETLSLFLALALNLLVFFIVMLALSTPRVEPADVMENFALASLDPPPHAVPQNMPVAAETQALLDVLAHVFEAEFPLEPLEVAFSDAVVQIRMRADAIFIPETATVRPPRRQFLDRIVAALSVPPSGLSYAMEFRLGSDYALKPASAEQANKAERRAGAFARALVDRGASPDLLSVGVEEGNREMARLVFRVLETPPSLPQASSPQKTALPEKQ